MDPKCNQQNNDRITGRSALVEIVTGYCFILGVMAIMFFGASGIGLEIPWEVFAGVFAVGGLLVTAAFRNRFRESKQKS